MVSSWTNGATMFVQRLSLICIEELLSLRALSVPLLICDQVGGHLQWWWWWAVSYFIIV